MCALRGCRVYRSDAGKRGNRLNASAPISAARAAMPHGRVILASSLGTGCEWYDFFLYGSLAAVISKQFFAGVNDLVGRKKTFLATIIIMGTSTTLVGLLPTYQSAGIAAPIM
jgi:MFS family permease